MKADVKSVGRPSKYTDAIGNEICDRLADGESLLGICRDAHMPSERTVRTWAIDPEHPISPKYMRARELGYMRMADELLDISDDGTNDFRPAGSDDDEFEKADHEHIARSRLRVDTRKWLLSKMLPKVFGEKITNELVGKDGTQLIPSVNVMIARKEIPQS